MSKPDLCHWWDKQRIKDEEAVWQRDLRFHDYAQIIDAVAEEFKAKAVIEVGCGMAHVGDLLAKLRPTLKYFGTDGSDLMIQAAKEKYPDLNLRVLNIRDTEAKLPKAQVVFAFAVLKHFSLDVWEQALRRILSMAPIAVIQVQVRVDDLPSIEDDFFGKEVAHHWLNEKELVAVYESMGLEFVNPWRETWNDVSRYCFGGREAVIISRQKQR